MISEKADGVYDLVGSPYQEEALSRVPVADLWTVGPAYSAMPLPILSFRPASSVPSPPFAQNRLPLRFSQRGASPSGYRSNSPRFRAKSRQLLRALFHANLEPGSHPAFSLHI